MAADLRGYGDSGKPHGDPQHLNYAKRAMAQDMVEVMQQLGYESFLLVGHDRGARVSHRLAKDHPQRVRRMALLDIIPTHKMFKIVNKEMATNTYHWFFLIQPYDFPERVIGAGADYFIRSRFERSKDAPRLFPPRPWRSMCVAPASRRPSTPCARIIALERASTWCMMRPISPTRSPARCSSCGVPPGMSDAPRMSLASGVSMPPMCVASRCRVAIISPKRCRTRPMRAADYCWIKRSGLVRLSRNRRPQLPRRAGQAERLAASPFTASP